MFKSRSPIGDHGGVFNDISTLKCRLKRYEKYEKIIAKMVKKDNR